MRRKHFVLIPVVLFALLVVWVVTSFDTLPDVARWAGGVIAVLAVLVFIYKQVKMEIDLRKGIVHIISGVITKKIKRGGNRKRRSRGISGRSAGRNSSGTYFIYIDDRKFNVPPKIYSKVKEGDKVEMNYFPESQYYLGIKTLL